MRIQTHRGFAATEQDILVIMDNLQAGLALTLRRVAKLLVTQKRNPTWAAYDKYADDVVGIDVRIEEQEAIIEHIEGELVKFEADLAKLKQKQANCTPSRRERCRQASMELGV